MIFTLWFIGDSIAYSQLESGSGPQRHLHISLAVLFSVFLWWRIFWRLKSGHPKLDGQSTFDHWIANTAHYLMIIAIAVMLVSGPTMVWTLGSAIDVFGWFQIPSPTGIQIPVYRVALSAHQFCAKVMLVVVLIHMCGAFNHLMFHNDDIFLRMLTPKKSPSKSRHK